MKRNRWYAGAFAGSAAFVVVCDLASKQFAATSLAGRDVPIALPPFGDVLRLALFHNDGFAFGVSFGAYTWSVNVALTVVTLALLFPVCRALSELDARAPYALGLIAGAALGNLVGLSTSPKGVVDFLAVDHGGGHEIVLNFADVAVYLGVALLARTSWVIFRAIQTERMGQPRRASLEVEVHRIVHVERTAPMFAREEERIWQEESVPQRGAARPLPDSEVRPD
ncbi:MAG: signal peptidase II [Gemmatimonadaceae bacterium]